MAKPLLSLVPDDFTADNDSPAADKVKAHQAAGIREGRRRERQEQDAKAARLTAEHQAHVAGIKSAQTDELARHDARWEREEAKHGSAKFWSGVSVGLFVAGAVVAVGLSFYTNSIIAPTFDAARQSRVQDDVVRTLEQAVRQ